MYRAGNSLTNHVAELKTKQPAKDAQTASYGGEPHHTALPVSFSHPDTFCLVPVDAPIGFLVSFPFTPLYAYATLKGKFDIWDRLLSRLPDEALRGQSLDAGCGRGLVLIKTAKAKEARGGHAATHGSCHGIDIFSTADQSGNSPEATVANTVVENVSDDIVLHSASFLDLPYADNVFSLVTSSLARAFHLYSQCQCSLPTQLTVHSSYCMPRITVHNPPDKEDRKKAIEELARVLKPGGTLLLLDLSGSATTKLYETTLRGLGWHDVKRSFAGMGVAFGLWYCETIIACKPKTRTNKAKKPI